MRVIVFVTLLLAASTSAWTQPAPPAAAEIVSLQGKGDYREADAADWKPAKIKQTITPNQFVRTTQPHSKMALLLADQTQMTLEGVSFAQVKSPDAAPRRSIIEFGQGKGRFQTKTPTREFKVGTPTGLAAIRGTEWLVEVEEGRSAFTVVEGEIEISNDLGALLVGADEQGILERGKAPSKRRVQDARERVQWVSSFTVDPDRYSSASVKQATDAVRAGEISRARADLGAALARGDASVEAYLLASDIELYFGRAREALAILDRAAASYPSDARIPGLTARAALFVDDFPRARAAATDAVARYPDNVESRLAAGEVARLDGDYRSALMNLRSATLVAPNDWRGWHALGQLQSERAYPSSARWALDEADRIAPNNATVLSERGLVEANAYALPKAREVLDRALTARPDDFATWTALGYARLKSGDLPGALDALLKATLLEPRSARAHLYLGIAYWQLGRGDEALAEMRTASRYDPRDPLPYQYTAMMQSDLMRPGDALGAARESVARLPFLKSLDPIATDLQGSANLGAPFAQLGLEAWALKNAHDSFDPMWAGSHFFLADRLNGKYARTSELIQGFITDPLAMGASNRFQSLVSRPGSYGLLGLRVAANRDGRLAEPRASANGTFAEGQMAYFADASHQRYRIDGDSLDDRGTVLTLGFGARPREDLGLFFYGFHFDNEQGLATGSGVLDPYDIVAGKAWRFDAGVHYRPSPYWQMWLKGGLGGEDGTQRIRTVQSAALTQLFRDQDLASEPRRRDAGLRVLHRDDRGLEYYGVIEGGTWESIDYFERDAAGRATATQARFIESVRQDIRDEWASAAAGLRWPIASWIAIEAEVDFSDYSKANSITVRRDYINQLVNTSDDHSSEGWSTRAGAVVRPGGGITLRAAWQEWLRPNATSTLKPTSTAGITPDERYVLPGGKVERARVQAEWQAMPDLLVTAFADRQEFANLYSPLTGVLNNRPDVSNLERLRNRSFNPISSLHELDGEPQIPSGELRESGLAVNALPMRQLSVYAEAAWARDENTGPNFSGKRLPWMPKQRYGVGAAWFSDARWSVAVQALYRGARYLDEANLLQLPKEWTGSVQAYWESRDKRWSLEAYVANIGAKAYDEAAGIAVNFRF